MPFKFLLFSDQFPANPRSLEGFTLSSAKQDGDWSPACANCESTLAADRHLKPCPGGGVYHWTSWVRSQACASAVSLRLHRLASLSHLVAWLLTWTLSCRRKHTSTSFPATDTSMLSVPGTASLPWCLGFLARLTLALQMFTQERRARPEPALHAHRARRLPPPRARLLCLGSRRCS